MSDDARHCWTTAIKNLEEPDYNIADANIEPGKVKIPSGKDLDPEAVVTERRRDEQNLIDFEAFEWVRDGDVDPAGKWINSR